MKRINVGLIGFGTVGSGVVKVLRDNAEGIREKLGCEVVLKRIADKDVVRPREVEVDKSMLAADASAVLDDPEISVVIELIGGIDAAKGVILKAIDKGKHVVTANKALLSTHGKEIFEAASKKGVSVGFEASVAGGIPIIKALREGLAANKIEAISGIINGTSNYILSKMTNEGGKFETVLKEAQKKGYAEADPTYDVEGIDAAHKLAILINLAYGGYVDFGDIYTEGISRITDVDIAFAKEFNCKIKLLAVAKAGVDGVEARVHPALVPLSHPLSSVDGVFNAVHITGDAVGQVMFYGRGAGMMPTASAVVADIMDIARDAMRGAKEPYPAISLKPGRIKVKKMDDIESSFYTRFSAVDKPGVLSRISGVFGEHGISISSVIQKGRMRGGAVPLVIVTHSAPEREFRRSIEEIEKLDMIQGKAMHLRIEETAGEAK